MALDVTTLLVINAANLLVVATALPLLMGQRLSSAAGSARASLMVQALGWVAILFSGFWAGRWQDLMLSTFSIACFSVGQWLMFEAMQGWLGPRRGRALLLGLVVLTPIGYALSFHNYPIRVGWANFMLATQLLILALSTLRPTSSLGGPWRWAILGCALTMAGFTAARGVMGAFFTGLYPTFLAPHPVNVMAVVATIVTLVLSSVAILVAWRGEAEAQLRQQAFSDSLTGLTNRKGWDELATAVFDQARRHAYPLALLMVDLDHFKHINETQGHDVGDQVLRMVGKLIRANRRSGDLAARIGGEEFALLLPQTDQAGALLLEQRLRQALGDACREQPQLKVNYSVGLTLLQPSDASLTALMVRADSALYRAKDLGRGRIEIEI